MSNIILKILGGLITGVALIIGIFFYFNPFLFWGADSPFKTQEIIYRNKENKNVTIEFQLQDIGAFGYNRRIVKVTGGVISNSIEKIDTATIDKTKWDLVNEDVNELNLKGG